MHLLSFAFTAALLADTVAANPTGDRHGLPIVDLGYVKQQATTHNARSTGRYYGFHNIAFAAPPLGNLRFAAPQPPKPVRGIQRGDSSPKKCPQAWPAWLAEAFTGSPDVPVSPYESEDCLYLDVFVPEKIFERRHLSAAPVLVWIYGGGYVISSKDDYNASGILSKGMESTNSDGVILVNLNYRLGAFGFLGGSDFSSQGGTPNAGLLDQRMALEWVQQHICQFGGDKNRVTVIGESGGGSSIGHHLTAGSPNNKDHTPFQQAIFQSPFEYPDISPDVVQNEGFANFLSKLNVKTLAEARKLDSQKLQKVNRDISHDSPSGQFPVSLAIDGSYVLSTINQGLVAGRYNHNIKIITGYNQNDGSIFSPNSSAPGYSFPGYVAQILPKASKATLSRITNDLYSEKQFPDAANRVETFVDEAYIKCNTYALQRAFNKQGYAYDFAVPPAVHVQDVDYTFYDGHSPPAPYEFYPKIADDMQTYFTNFAVHGNPNAGRLSKMEKYEEEGNILVLAPEGYTTKSDPKDNPRCEYWATFNDRN